MKCHLCKEDKELMESHIIPKFIFRWIKKTSITGKLRSTDNPNLRKQDGKTKKIFCADCEQKLSVIEKYFKEEFFDKAKNNNLEKSEVTIELFDFCVSLILRNLKLRMINNKVVGLEPKEIAAFKEVIDKCRIYFINKNLDVLNDFNFHLIPTTKNMEEKGKINYNSFINQRVTAHAYRAFCEEKEGFDYLIFYVKIPFFLILVEIIPNLDYEWFGTELDIGNIVCDESNIDFDSIIIDILYLLNQNKNKSREKVSKNQLSKLEENVKKILKNNPDKINSRSITSMNRSNEYSELISKIKKQNISSE